MIVCHCTLTTSGDIEAAVARLRARDPATIVTPGAVYRELGRRPVCGGCQPLFGKLMGRADPGLPPNLRD